MAAMNFASISSKINERYDAECPYPNKKTDGKKIVAVALILFVIFIVINTTRLFNNNFWGDEIYSIDVAHMSFTEIIDYAANIDSHPPLYNLYLALMCRIFGFNPFVYQFSSMLPYIGIMIIGVTFVRKNFGSMASIMFMSLSSMLAYSFYFVPEVRMYELGAFLFLFSFMSTYYVLTTGEKKWYVLLIISSLASAYTHYYCMLASVLLYISIFFYLLTEQKSELKKFIPVGIITLLCYLPWAIVSLFPTVKKDTEQFWITDSIPITDGLGILFSGVLAWPLLIIFFITVTILLKRNYASKSIEYHRIESAWVIMGIVCVFCSMMFGVIISLLTRPLLIVRYLYPVSIAAWLILSISVSRLNCFKINKIKLSAIIVTLFIIISAPAMAINLNQEYSDNQSTQDIVNCVNDNTADGDVIITNIFQLKNNVCGYYFPNLETIQMNEDVPTIQNDRHYILILDQSTNMDQITKQLKDQNYAPIELIRGHFTSNYNVSVYNVVAI